MAKYIAIRKAGKPASTLHISPSEALPILLKKHGKNGGAIMRELLAIIIAGQRCHDPVSMDELVDLLPWLAPTQGSL